MVTRADIDSLINAYEHYNAALKRATGKSGSFGAYFDTLSRFLEAATACNASIQPCAGMSGSFMFMYAGRDFYYFAHTTGEEEVE